MTMTHCPHCGEQLEPEIKRPDGCVCDAQEWDDPYNLPPVCDKFDPDSVGQNCVRCEHDYECHAEARANGEVKVANPQGEASSAEGATSTVVGAARRANEDTDDMEQPRHDGWRRGEVRTINQVEDAADAADEAAPYGYCGCDCDYGDAG